VAKSPLVSVVTPVRNGAAHLAECAGSVRSQTYQNWEYVIVDNQSTDRTPEIAKSLAKADSRIRYVRHEQPVGVVKSYNRAFDAASEQSTYCKVIGVDDLIYPPCLEQMVELAEETGVDLVGAYRLHEQKVDLMDLTETVTEGHRVIRGGLLWDLHVLGSPTSLMYRTRLVHLRKPFFDESFRHADTEAGYWLLLRSSFAQVRQLLTYQNFGGESLVSIQNHTLDADHLRMFIRYGPLVFTESEFRWRLRKQLIGYAWMLTKRWLKYYPPDDKHFIRFHTLAMKHMRAESPGDEEIAFATEKLTQLLYSGLR
jgi:glycosyltransferase involved in cell wall biosynthesis